MSTRPTPETQAILSKVAGGLPSYTKPLVDGLEKLERERDEAREAKLGLCKLSTEKTWQKVSEANALRGHIDELQTLLPNDSTLATGIRRLQHELAEKDAQIMALRGALEEVNANIYAPDAHCSCHIAPPCNDCVENGGLREVLETVKKALSAPAPAVVPIEDVRPLVEAAENTRHWHDCSPNHQTGETEGVIVSKTSFWKLKDALSTFTAKHPL